MNVNCIARLLAGWVSIHCAMAQTTSFSAAWRFDGGLNGSSSTPLVTAESATLANILVPSVGGYPAGQVGQAVNLQNWSDPACPGNEYLEIRVSPGTNVTMKLTSLTFFFSRSASGPADIKVKHSLDGFSSTLYASTITATGTPYQSASIDLTGANPAFASQTQPVSFRFYGCNRTATNGTMRLDDIVINATALPVTLVSFTAEPIERQVQLNWITTNERNVSRFRTERSRDRLTYTLLGETNARGTTDSRQTYTLTDPNPLPGLNYYRLSQLDRDGAVTYFRPLAVTVREGELVAMVVNPNPADGGQIHLLLSSTDDVSGQLFTPMGQEVSGQLIRRQDEADFLPNQPLAPGLYLLTVQTATQRQVLKVLVR